VDRFGHLAFLFPLLFPLPFATCSELYAQSDKISTGHTKKMPENNEKSFIIA